MEPKTERWKKVKKNMLKSIGRPKPSGDSVLKKKRKATVGRICIRKGRF